METTGETTRSVRRIACLAPVVAMILTATAIPVELRSFSTEPFSFAFAPYDSSTNVLAYVAVGLALGHLGTRRAVLLGVLISAFAEISQLFMLHRTPSAADLMTNSIGTVLGVWILRRWRFPMMTLPLNGCTGLVALCAVLGILGREWFIAGPAINPRGSMEPGRLEARWSFDDTAKGPTIDSSGQGLHARLVGDARIEKGVVGGALALDGTNTWMRAPRSAAFRLTGSMTVCAWILSTAYPVDDAAIVSTLDTAGFQLDTTIDRGPRTIGFKLTDPCGRFMGRYGATPLKLGQWYHLAGVYNANSATIDVYLNGKPDNGELRGSVTHQQRSSRAPACIGHRIIGPKYDFTGLIDDVQIHSAALSAEQIFAIMSGGLPKLGEAGTSISPQSPPTKAVGPCPMTTRGDSSLPGLAGTLGTALVIACLGLFPRMPKGAVMLLCLGIGIWSQARFGNAIHLAGGWMLSFATLGCALVTILSVRTDHYPAQPPPAKS